MIRITITTALLMMILAGCSSGNQPVIPPETLSDGTPAITDSSEVAVIGNRAIWGLYQWEINLQEGTIESVPLRGLMAHYNVVTDMNTEPPNIKFEGLSIDKANNTIGLDVLLFHPYPSRPNLAGFDVHGIMIGSGSVTGFSDPSIRMAGNQDPRILNPDGLTRWWNPVEFNIGDDVFSYTDGDLGIKFDVGQYNATLNGYKTFSDDLGNIEDYENLNLSDRLIFSTDALHTRHYDVWFPVEDDTWIIRYNYAIDASWKPIPGYTFGDEVNIPTDWEPTANQSEPFMARVQEMTNSLYFETESSKGGNGEIDILVYDWQGYLGDGAVADQIESIQFESPGKYDGVVTGVMTDPGNHGASFATYRLHIEGSKLLEGGDLSGLLTVVSSEGDYQSSFTGYSGSAPLAYYRYVELGGISSQFIPENELPIAVAFIVGEGPFYAGEFISFDGSLSNDPDGEITDFMWDFDNDGMFGDLHFGGTNDAPVVPFLSPGEHLIDLQVTDDYGDTDTLDEKIVLFITAEPTDPPFAAAFPDKSEAYIGEMVTFNGLLSYDPDGSVVMWEWDFDSDGTFGDPYDSGSDPVPQISFDTGGEHLINLRVTDNLGATDILDSPVVITVMDPLNSPPVAVANSNLNEVISGQVINFDGTESYDPDGTILNWAWDFDNDGAFGDTPIGGTDQQPQFAFYIPGVHFVNLQVTDDMGALDTLDEKLFCIVIDPDNILPVAISDVDKSQGTVEDMFYFDASGSYDPDGIIQLFEWDFDNDGSFGDSYDSGTDMMPVKNFNMPGEYFVCMRVFDNGGGFDITDECLVIDVTPVPNVIPTAIAEHTGMTDCMFSKQEFDATLSYDPDGFIDQYLWDFENDGIFGDPYDSGTDSMPVKSFTTGTHFVNLKVIDNMGGEAMLDAHIEVIVLDEVSITLDEDQYYKSVYGWRYDATNIGDPIDIPVDYGPSSSVWDFTGHSSDDSDLVEFLSTSAYPVAGYIPEFFPPTTQYFAGYSFYADQPSGWIYLAEEIDPIANVLYIHGQLNFSMDETVEIFSYNEQTGGPVEIQFPLDMGMDESWEISIPDEQIPYFIINYRETGICQGDFILPDGVEIETSGRALLTRTLIGMSFPAGDPIMEAVIYKWTDDYGIQIARLYACNMGDWINFDPVTFAITGNSRLAVIREEIYGPD